MMSAVGTKRTSGNVRPMSALGGQSRHPAARARLPILTQSRLRPLSGARLLRRWYYREPDHELVAHLWLVRDRPTHRGAASGFG